MPHLESRSVAAFVSLALVLFGVSRAASAQERQTPAAEVFGGVFLFPDDGLVIEPFVGGAVRMYVLPRVSLGPEIIYIDGANHSHLTLTGNVTYDFAGPWTGQRRRVTPFLIGGVGVFQSRGTALGTDFTSTQSFISAGGGARVVVGKNVYLGIESRVGWPLHVQANVTIGTRLGK